MQTLKKYLYFVLIFGAIFVDCPTGVQMGIFGRCWLSIVLPVVFVVYIVLNKRFVVNTYIKGMLIFLLWLVIVSLVSNVFFSIENQSSSYAGESIYVKSFKTILYWIDIIIYMVLILDLTKDMNRKEIIKPFVFTFFFLFGVLLIELTQIPYAFSNLHYNAYLGYYNRVRLTATESSTTVPLIICYGYMSLFYSFYLSKSKILRILILGMLAVFIGTTSSKTILLIVVATLLFLVWNNRKQISRKYFPLIIIGAVLALGGSMVAGTYLWERMIQTAGSTGVRLIQLIAGIFHSICYPVGNGGAAYMKSYKDIYAEVYRTLAVSDIGSMLRYTEVLQMLSANDETGLGVIAGIWQMGLYCGIGGIVFWMYITWQHVKELFIVKQKGYYMLKSLFVVIVVMWMFSISVYNCYWLWATVLLLGTNNFITEK